MCMRLVAMVTVAMVTTAIALNELHRSGLVAKLRDNDSLSFSATVTTVKSYYKAFVCVCV